MCLTDLFATVAEVAGVPVPAQAGEDSVSLLPVLRAQGDIPPRPAVVHHSVNGSFAIRQGAWKLLLCSGSGGWSAPRPGSAEARAAELAQLYNLAEDPAEQRNLAAQKPEKVAELTRLLKQFVAQGRSTAGPPQQNDVPVEIWRDKLLRPAKPAVAKPQ